MKMTSIRQFIMKRGLEMIFSIVLGSKFLTVGCTSSEKDLFHDLFSNYSNEIRPVINVSNRVVVLFGLSIHQIVALNEKNQQLKVSVWTRQKWNNHLLQWDPSKYDGITSINVEASRLWKPDIYLYNNANEEKMGNLDKFSTKVVVSSDGSCMWLAPAIFQSFCNIDVTYFPFDEQLCHLKFGSWTYHGFLVDIRLEAEQGDTNKFVINGEWELISMPARRNVRLYSCCPEFWPDVTYAVHIRRRTVFYMINMVIPCALITGLSLLSFMLPPESGERVTLVITNMLAMTVFMLMAAEMMPPVGNTVPLISLYYTVALSEVAASLVITCLVLKCYFRNPTTRTMPMWFRVLVLGWLAKVMKVSTTLSSVNLRYPRSNSNPLLRGNQTSSCQSLNIKEKKTNCSVLPQNYDIKSPTRPLLKSPENRGDTTPPIITQDNSFNDLLRGYQATSQDHGQSPSNIRDSGRFSHVPNITRVQGMFNDVRYLSETAEDSFIMEMRREEWKLAATVIDRFFLLVFMLLIFFSTLAMFFHVYAEIEDN